MYVTFCSPHGPYEKWDMLGPCGEQNVTSPCMKNGTCSKKYPRRFVTDTQTGEDGYLVYQRHDVDNDGQVATMRLCVRTVTIDNT